MRHRVAYVEWRGPIPSGCPGTAVRRKLADVFRRTFRGYAAVVFSARAVTARVRRQGRTATMHCLRMEEFRQGEFDWMEQLDDVGSSIRDKVCVVAIFQWWLG